LLGGATLTSNTEAQGKGGKTAGVKTKNGATVSANAIVVATNTPVDDWFIALALSPLRMYGSKQKN